MYGNILIPTDGSPGMGPVIDHAVSLAAAHGATLHGVYVVNTASLSDLPMESSWEGLSQALHREGEKGIEAIRERVTDVPLETAILEGAPSREIVAYAEETPCDIIVMGTHGRSGVNRILLGSVAERVVRTSSVPVLTIRVNRDEI